MSHCNYVTELGRHSVATLSQRKGLGPEILDFGMLWSFQGKKDCTTESLENKPTEDGWGGHLQLAVVAMLTTMLLSWEKMKYSTG